MVSVPLEVTSPHFFHTHALYVPPELLKLAKLPVPYFTQNESAEPLGQYQRTHTAVVPVNELVNVICPSDGAEPVLETVVLM
ncbi:MAG: hypothetical protein A3G75_07690 [Verrucomicrobia bacterium RIFCSPLOWO2_12_FULL_64_8]|nr:MAG: hypothetical protein A3G75_07690 [Verrucomicrobia bacterium RIFCSPLOWO2_12_FULL_64_8]